ncbi:MAG: universal stress protein [Hyphomicrobiaceae bacterium]
MSPTETIQMSPVGRFERFLLPTDGSEYSRGAEQVAIAMCRKSGAKLHAMRAIVKPAGAVSYAPEADAQLENEATEQLARLSVQAEAGGAACETTLHFADDPYQAIVKAARELPADMIVMGRRGRRGLARLMLGDATAKVMGYAPCPVMVVPERAGMWCSILIATDGSRSSDAAVVTASHIAKCCDVPVTVLSVRVPSHSDRRQAEAQVIVDRALTYLAQEKVGATGAVEDGIADEVIVDVASRLDKPLVVLGSHGRTGIGRVLFGSKTERVINYASGPVLVVGNA